MHLERQLTRSADRIAMVPRFSIAGCIILFVVFLSAFALASSESESESSDYDASSGEFVLTLDSSNFSEAVSKHNFIVVEFYAPWCGHCKKLAPEYEKAAYLLSKHYPPVVLAKIDANDDANKDLASKYEVGGFPTIKILRNAGNTVQEYKGPRDAVGIVEYLKKQAGPASIEIKSSEDAGNLMDDKKILVVGVFPELSGEEFENFTALAEKMRSDYDFGHTLDARFLPGEVFNVDQPKLRLFKPFDEPYVDFKDFNVDAMEKFVEEATLPIITLFNKDPHNHPFVAKFFNNANAKAMVFMNFSSENFETFKFEYHNVAVLYKGQGISFLLGDLEASHGAFQYFGLEEEQVPLIIIQKSDGRKYLKSRLEPDHIRPWLEEYMDDKVKPFIKSQPIPEVNDGPVKVVVADNLHDIVYKSGKNVLLEFYAPWCGHCQKLAPILEEVAVSFATDATVVIAKIDATANDYPNEDFDVKGYPTLYFSSASGKLVQYDGDRSKEDIIEFIKKNKDAAIDSEDIGVETTYSTKDEL